MNSTRALINEKVEFFLDNLSKALPLHKIYVSKSDISSSQYIYVVGNYSAVCLRVSDHLREINPRRLKFETKRQEVQDFYYFVKGNFGNFKEFYYPDNEDKLVSNIVEYFNVPSKETGRI